MARDLQIPARLGGTGFGYPVKAGEHIGGRNLVALTAAGLAVTLAHADAAAFAGMAIEAVSNRDGADGAAKVGVIRDVRGFNFAATPADLNKPVYASDDETITLDQATGKFRIGLLVGIDDGRVWVNLGV